MRLHRFHGGLSLPRHKSESTAAPIQVLPPPARLVVPLLQHAGEPARACVAVGEPVLRGQRIGTAPESARGAHVHAPTSGTVLELARAAAAPHRDGIEAVVIAADGRDAWQRLPALDPDTASPAELLQRIADAGVVGLGGAGFPSHDKLEVPRQLLVLNGAECEPWIACDDRLLRERAAEVVAGGRVLQRITGAGQVLLAIEDAMPEALAAARAAAAADGGSVQVVAVPTVYPQGGEKQLIRVLTGREVPQGGLPRALGIVVQNVGTAAAAWRAVVHGEALTSRIVTVTGRGVARPGNFEVRIGTPVSELLAAAGGYTEEAARLVVGGPLMGQALPDDGHAITKAANCILVLAADDVREHAPVLPCIRCGACARACPVSLLPQQLHAFIGAERWQRATDHGLFDCIECGCCDLVCPSHLPLVEWFRFGKSELRARAHETGLAEAARLRFEVRQQRSAREQEEQALRRARAAAPDAVRRALERAGATRPRPVPGTDADGGD